MVTVFFMHSVRGRGGSGLRDILSMLLLLEVLLLLLKMLMLLLQLLLVLLVVLSKA